MQWKVRLENSSSLLTLSRDFADDPEIFEEDGEFYIWSSRFTGLDAPDEVRAEAENIVRTIRSFGELDPLSVHDLETSNVYKLLDNGREHIYVDHGTAPPRKTGKGITTMKISNDRTKKVIKSPAERTAKRTQLALQDKKVEELSSLLHHERSWANMYHI